MGDGFKILIADRNRHVRELLRRELSVEGFQVAVAKDGREVLMMLQTDGHFDLLILDLEAPYVSELALLERLNKLNPDLPIIIHTFLNDDLNRLKTHNVAAFLEKEEDIDLLKNVVAEVIGKYYPVRFKAAQGK